MRRSSEAGSHVVGLALAVVVIAAVGFAGYKVWTMQPAATNEATANTAAAAVPAKITNKATLDQAGAVLDQSSAQLNAGLDSSSLNTYLSALL